MNQSNVCYLGYDLNLDKEWDYDFNNRGHYTTYIKLWYLLVANGTHSITYGQELP